MQLSPALAALLAISVRLSQVQAVPISLAPADDVDDSMLLDGLDPFEDIFEPLPTGTFGDAAEDLIDAEMEASASSASTASAETREQVTEAFLSRYFTHLTPGELATSTTPATPTTSAAPMPTGETIEQLTDPALEQSPTPSTSGEQPSTTTTSPTSTPTEETIEQLTDPALEQFPTPSTPGEQPSATTTSTTSTPTAETGPGEQIADAFSDQYSTSQSASSITILSRPFSNLVLGDVSSLEATQTPAAPTSAESPIPSASVLLDSEDVTTATVPESQPIFDWMPVPTTISDVDSPVVAAAAEILDAPEGAESLSDSVEDRQEYGIWY